MLQFLEITENGDPVVARGSDVQITVRGESPGGSSPGAHPGSVPRNVWCRWTTRSGNTDRRLMERVTDTTTYTTIWPEVLEGFEFHVDRTRRVFYTDRAWVVDRVREVAGNGLLNGDAACDANRTCHCVGGMYVVWCEVTR